VRLDQLTDMPRRACCRCRRDEKRGEATKRILPCKLLHPTIANIAPSRRLTHQRHSSLFFSLSTRNFLPPRSRPHQCSGYVRFTRDCELSKKMQMSKSTLSNLLFHPPTVRRKLPSGSVVSLERGIQLLTQCKLFCFGRSFLS